MPQAVPPAKAAMTRAATSPSEGAIKGVPLQYLDLKLTMANAKPIIRRLLNNALHCTGEEG